MPQIAAYNPPSFELKRFKVPPWLVLQSSPETHTKTHFSMECNFNFFYQISADLCACNYKIKWSIFGKGEAGLSLEPFGRAGQLSAKWADRKKENFWPLKLMTQLHWETVWWRNNFYKKSSFPFLHSSCHRQNMYPFWGIFGWSLSKFSPNVGQKTELPKYPLLVQTICIYRFARSCLHRISLYKYY